MRHFILRSWWALFVLTLVGCSSSQRLPTPGTARDMLEPLEGNDHLVFAYFRRDVPGLFLALSRNGFTWIGSERPVHVFDGAFRDPSIARGPGGWFHMVWTTGQPQRIGYAASDNLLDWSRQRSLHVMKGREGCRNCWAPEVLYDHESKSFLLHWSSTLDGAFIETAGDTDGNNRIYACTTRDFRTLDPTFLLFDPGFNVIDSSIRQRGREYLLFFKDERLDPKPRKRIHLARGKNLKGPYTDISDPISIQWVEGPAPIKLADGWIVYYDFYVYWHNEYGAMMSQDLEEWSDVTPRVRFPKNARHGCVNRIGRPLFEELLKGITAR